MWVLIVFFFFKQKTAYEMRISDWSSDVCSSDLQPPAEAFVAAGFAIDGNADFSVFLEALFHGRSQRAFERSEDHFARDILFARQGIDQQKNFATHRF